MTIFNSKRSADILERTVQEQLSQIESLESKLMRAQAESAICKKNLSRCIMCFVNLSKGAMTFKLYTGTSVDVFCNVERILDASTSTIMDSAGMYIRYASKTLSVSDKLLLTLVKMRHNFPESDLPVRYGIS